MRAQPPLFKLERGKNVKYAFSDTERDQIRPICAGPRQGQGGDKPNKGLGEDFHELWETRWTLKRGILKRITLRTHRGGRDFHILMGEKGEPRGNTSSRTQNKSFNLDF
jgi:DNA gyrase subunit B